MMEVTMTVPVCGHRTLDRIKKTTFFLIKNTPRVDQWKVDVWENKPIRLHMSCWIMQFVWSAEINNKHEGGGMITNSLVHIEKLTTKERWLVVYCVLNINAETEWGWGTADWAQLWCQMRIWVEREREWTPGRGGDQGNKVRQGDSDIFVSKSEKISLL